MTGPAIGAESRPLRFFIVTLVIAVYLGFGLLLHLDVAEYQLLGIPFLLIFQLGIQRQPLRTLWVRSGPPLRLDAGFFILWVLFSVVPTYQALRMAHADPARAALYGTGIAGAFGLAYALRAMRAENVRQLGLCLLTTGSIVLLPLLLGLLLRHALHLHFQVGQATAVSEPVGFLPSLQTGLETFLWGLPAGFVVEEVFFRGALDTYLHRGEEGIGWLSAIFVSALWGLWHLPGQAKGPHLLSTVLTLVVAQIAVGVPLSFWWRQSGNLTVNNTTHALLDAVRDVLAALV